MSLPKSKEVFTLLPFEIAQPRKETSLEITQQIEKKAKAGKEEVPAFFLSHIKELIEKNPDDTDEVAEVIKQVLEHLDILVTKQDVILSLNESKKSLENKENTLGEDYDNMCSNFLQLLKIKKLSTDDLKFQEPLDKRPPTKLDESVVDAYFGTMESTRDLNTPFSGFYSPKIGPACAEDSVDVLKKNCKI